MQSKLILRYNRGNNYTLSHGSMVYPKNSLTMLDVAHVFLDFVFKYNYNSPWHLTSYLEKPLNWIYMMNHIKCDFFWSHISLANFNKI